MFANETIGNLSCTVFAADFPSYAKLTKNHLTRHKEAPKSAGENNYAAITVIRGMTVPEIEQFLVRQGGKEDGIIGKHYSRDLREREAEHGRDVNNRENAFVH